MVAGFVGFGHSRDTTSCSCYYDSSAVLPEAESFSNGGAGDVIDEDAGDQICFKYKFEGAWPTVSPTQSPHLRKVRQFNDVLVTMVTSFTNIPPASPIISRTRCYSAEFSNGFEKALESAIASYLDNQQEIQAELTASSLALEGACRFESLLTVKVAELCIEPCGANGPRGMSRNTITLSTCCVPDYSLP